MWYCVCETVITCGTMCHFLCAVAGVFVNLCADVVNLFVVCLCMFVCVWVGR